MARKRETMKSEMAISAACIALAVVCAIFLVEYLSAPKEADFTSRCAMLQCDSGQIGVEFDDRCFCATPVYDLSRHGLLR